LAKECHFNTQTGLFLSYDFLFISAKNIRENDALDVFPPYLSINCSFFSKVSAFFSIYSYFVDFFTWRITHSLPSGLSLLYPLLLQWTVRDSVQSQAKNSSIDALYHPEEQPGKITKAFDLDTKSVAEVTQSL